MVQVRQDDLLRALKSFKGLAKQDLLAGNHTPETEYRKTHAEARRETYAKLISLVEESGIEEACVFAFREYINSTGDNSKKDGDDPVNDGHLQALQLFFKVIGVTGDKLDDLKIKNLDINELISVQVPQVQNGYCM
ncbi:MAG TPA: hypothetical protein VHY08_07860 [Bacillota bacterium]|nr:hypothetical protein [Bacillota bacterium]